VVDRWEIYFGFYSYQPSDKSFEAERPWSLIILPRWDLILVLRILRKTSFEPLSKVPLEHLTQRLHSFYSNFIKKGGRRTCHRPLEYYEEARGDLLVPNSGYLPKIYDCAELSDITPRHLELTLYPARTWRLLLRLHGKRLPTFRCEGSRGTREGDFNGPSGNVCAKDSMAAATWTTPSVFYYTLLESHDS
jgi:hypothetical protein